MTLSTFISRWCPDFRRTPRSIATRRAELIQRRRHASARHQATREIEAELQNATHAQLRCEIGMGR